MSMQLLQNILSRLTHIGVDPADSEQARLDKALLLLVTFLGAVSGLVWSVMYLALGQGTAAAIPAVYVVASGISITVFSRTCDFRFLRASHLLLILILPFALQIALGGFVNSSGVVLWSLLCPLGALLFASRGQAAAWFAAYLLSVIVSGLLQPHLRPLPPLAPGWIALFFVLNFAAISTISFVLISYFVRQKEIAYQLLNLEQQKAESLLLNMLPAGIAARLKDNQQVIADYHDQVTILFADLVDFTPLASVLTPEQVVELLNDVFSEFDGLVVREDAGDGGHGDADDALGARLLQQALYFLP